MSLVNLAQGYCKNAHDSVLHVRKYTGDPYWVHPFSVAARVRALGVSQVVEAAAYLHDTWEDVFPHYHRSHPVFSKQAFLRIFGVEVFVLVRELTDVFTKEDFPELNRRVRKHLETDRLSSVSLDAKTIKLADLIDNAESISEHDPKFYAIYRTEAIATLGALHGGDERLHSQLTTLLK